MHKTAEKTAPDALTEIEDLIGHHLPPLISFPANARLKDFAEAYRFLTEGQNRERPQLRHPRIAFFTNDEKAAAEYGSAGHPLTLLAENTNADFKIYDVSAAPAGTRADMAHAASYGMMAITPGIDLLIICIAAKEEKTGIVWGEAPPALAAAIGAIIAARLAKVPVLICGAEAEKAVALLKSQNPQATTHVRRGQDILHGATDLPCGCHATLAIPFLKSLSAL